MNGGHDWEKLRRQILFFSGLGGIFLYVVLTEVLGKEFHAEYLLVFLAMMGVSLTQGADKK